MLTLGGELKDVSVAAMFVCLLVQSETAKQILDWSSGQREREARPRRVRHAVEEGAEISGKTFVTRLSDVSADGFYRAPVCLFPCRASIRRTTLTTQGR